MEAKEMTVNQSVTYILQLVEEQSKANLKFRTEMFEQIFTAKRLLENNREHIDNKMDDISGNLNKKLQADTQRAEKRLNDKINDFEKKTNKELSQIMARYETRTAGTTGLVSRDMDKLRDTFTFFAASVTVALVSLLILVAVT